MPLAASRLRTRMEPSTSPTTQSRATLSRALDRQGIRLRVSPAGSPNGSRELFSIRGGATVCGTS